LMIRPLAVFNVVVTSMQPARQWHAVEIPCAGAKVSHASAGVAVVVA
jgi:hypothetical protein